MIRRQLAWTALAAIIPVLAGAQTIQDTNLHAWFMYFGDHPVNDRWGVHLESQVRRANAGLTWQHLLIRPGINYQLNKNVMLTAGYAYVRTSPYGDVPAKTAFPEHRVFEQALIKYGVKKSRCSTGCDWNSGWSEQIVGRCETASATCCAPISSFRSLHRRANLSE